MRVLAIFGITLSLGALCLGHALAGGSLAALFQPAALLIVLGGTIGAVCMQSTPVLLRRCGDAFLQAVRATPTTWLSVTGSFLRTGSCRRLVPAVLCAFSKKMQFNLSG